MMIAILLLITTSCSSGSNAIIPVPVSSGTAAKSSDNIAQTCLWGYYDVYFDLDTREFEAVENRTAAITLNIVPFLNLMMTPKNGITFDSIVTHEENPAFLGVDVNFTVYHPFPGYNQYRVYDLRGVVIGNGAQTLECGDLQVGKHGTDLWMKNADGYTRWFNPAEFTAENIFGYMPGGWQNYKGDAQLNPYKYYSKNLDADEDLWSYLTTEDNSNGLFESGTSRKMELEFPLPPNGIGLQFGYAVVVSWEDQGTEGPYYPTNTPEAVACNIVDNSTLYYVDPTNKGGNLILDIGLFGWSQQPSTIFIESTVLSSPYEFTVDEMTPIGGTENYSTYHVEICADNVTGTENNELWVITQYNGFDYTNEFGVINLVGDDCLSAYFRHLLLINSGWPLTWGGNFDDVGISVTTDGSGNTYVTGIFQGMVDFDPGPNADWHNGGCDVFLSKFNSPGVFLWAKTWSGGRQGHSVATDGANNVYITGFFAGIVDFDPGPGEDWHMSNGIYDIFLSKFDSLGNFLWAKTWGGDSGGQDEGNGVIADESGNTYVVGTFSGVVDFDPGPSEDWHTSHNGYDAFLSKFDSSGNFLWAKTWGGTTPPYSHGAGVAIDVSGNVYATGHFQGTVDFDPGSGEDNHTSNGSYDIFLSKFDSMGAFLWAKTWGGVYHDYSHSVAIDGEDNVYVTGNFQQYVDFDPGPGEDWHTSNSERSFFLSKFNAFGTFFWVSTWEEDSSGTGYGVATDESNNVYVTGEFSETVDFNPGPGVDNHTSNGDLDVFISKFDTLGTFLWAKTWGGSLWDAGFGVATDGAGNVYVTGFFVGIVDFDPGPGEDWHTSNGDHDVFLSKFSPE